MKLINKILLSVSLSLALITSVVAGSYAAKKDIVDIAASNDDFSTLVTAVSAAELVETLKGEGPFTVFAPTNDAFGKVPGDTLNALLGDKAALSNVLTYHVVAGKVMAADVVKLSSATTVQGQNIGIKVKDGKVFVDGAQVISTDIEASNGVIHVIDSVILPK
ncbi:MAG: fasciclin domain-containing protein [Cellvibrionaceae bacterium]